MIGFNWMFNKNSLYKNMIQNKFKHYNVNFIINPDKVVSIEAIITQKNSDEIKDVNLFDDRPLSLELKLQEKNEYYYREK